jgi:hypothetical protein
MEGKLRCWQGKLMPIGERLILIETSMNSIPLYMMSFYPLPKGTKKRMDFFMARFLWGEDQGIRKYHLVKWSVVCSPKECGGLGVKDLECMIVALLCKWLWKLETTEGMW